MAWMSHGRTNDELINNLSKHQLLTTPSIVQAMKSVDRYHFTVHTSDARRGEAYQDSPQSIGYGATISAPHMHAMCLELVKDYLIDGAAVLDVGSGSGYLTAVMAVLVGDSGKVIGIEHMKELAEFSKKNLNHYPELTKCIKIIHGDGRLGYPDDAPYDIIHVGAAAAQIPLSLKQQLRLPDQTKKQPGGVLVIPVGNENADQYLRLIKRTGENSYDDRVVTGVRYVPLTDQDHQRRNS